MPEEDTSIQLTIKSVPARTRDKMNRLAKRKGQTLGYWLTELVDKAEADELLPPDKNSRWPNEGSGPPNQGSGGRPRESRVVPPEFSIGDLRDAMKAMLEISQLTGEPIQKKTVNLVKAVVNKQLAYAKKRLDESLGGPQLLLPPDPDRARVRFEAMDD